MTRSPFEAELPTWAANPDPADTPAAPPACTLRIHAGLGDRRISVECPATIPAWGQVARHLAERLGPTWKADLVVQFIPVTYTPEKPRTALQRIAEALRWTPEIVRPPIERW